MPVKQFIKSVRRLTKDDLLFLLNKSNRYILQELVRTEFGFFAFLENRRYKEEEEVHLEMIVELLSKVCSLKRGEFKAKLDKLFRILKDCCEGFLFIDIPRIINSCFNQNPGINLVSFITQYMIILSTAMCKDFFPCDKIVNEIFPALENYMNRLRERKKYKGLEFAEKSFKDLKKKVESYEEPAILDDENDSEILGFRKLSIVPKGNEIVNYRVSFVPQNIIDRPYKSVELYLGIHYRLMREDMLRSFQECIRSFMSFENQGFSSRSLYFKNVKVASLPEYSTDGIMYKIHVTSIKEVDLSKKEALLPGTLVFLTDNGFQSVIFATVKTNPNASKGKTKEFDLTLRLEDESYETLLNENRIYELLQPAAYFESYKHILSAIKDFNESNFPLSDIITYFDFDDTVPYYLEDKTFCLHEMCGSSNKHDASDLCKCFDPLADNEWPDTDVLKLDEQQYLAFKTAITKKVALIQGPPGTGKTYIGKKVVKALLENTRNIAIAEEKAESNQKESENQNTPIVICCLTNHALDQFLEGIISEGITNKVVRLGKQSKSEMIEPHVLDNLMYAVRQYKDFCQDKERERIFDKSQEPSLNLLKDFANVVLNETILPEYDEEFVEIRNLCTEINQIVLQLSLCKDKYLDENALNDIIDLKYKKDLRKTPGYIQKSLSASVLEWLVCSRSKDFYDKCKKYFDAFRKMNIEQPSFSNVWHLTESKRYELFFVWRKRCLEILKKKLEDNVNAYKTLKCHYKSKAVDPVRLEILKNASVIGVTTTGACKYKDLIKFSKPRIIIFEEAAQILESHVIASLVPSIQHMILIGDHEQLRPLPADHDLSEKYNLKVSMFERLIRNQAPSATLVSQHRMKPCIAELLVPRPYTHFVSHDNVYKYEEVRGVQSSVFFFNHNHPEDNNSSGSSSSNKFEAQMIVCLAKYFVLQGYSVTHITILATYAAQAKLIHEFLISENLSGIYVTTVDNFQGEENEIILLSFVRNNQISIGFLKESNRVCVALSRAKKGMFCFGNFELYASKNDLWEGIIEKARAKNMLSDILILKCAKHLTLHPSKSPEDILTFINDGCPAICNFKLPCNHTCAFTCHFKDPDHRYYLCKQPCERMIDENRVCNRLCFERCKRIKKKQIELPCGHSGLADVTCIKEIQRFLPCKHFITVPCHLDNDQYKCEAPAKLKLKCGHVTTVSCYELAENISIFCTELRPVTGSCGHIVNVPCNLHLDDEELIPYCDKSCGTLLKCGHPCVAFCRNCFDTGIHGFCAEKCDLILSCGHPCQAYCNAPCPPCKLKCFIECDHDTRCVNECIRPCVKCEKPCTRRCKHLKCSKECHEVCNVKPCNQPCMEVLQCGHQCIGICGDPCPYLCRVCNADMLISEDPDNSLYVELECGDVIEINELDEHVENCLLSFEWPNCPKCSQVIKKSVRYKESLLQAKESCRKSNDTTETISEIRYLVESMYGVDFLVPAQFRPIHSRIMYILKKQNPSSDFLLVLKNCIMLLKKLVSIYPKLGNMSEEKLLAKFNTIYLWMFNRLTYSTVDITPTASFQQLNELELTVKQLEKDVARLFSV